MHAFGAIAASQSSYSIVLALAVATDVFVGFCACGGRGIRLKRFTAVVSAIVCAVIFLVFGLLGSVVTTHINDRAEAYIGAAVLLLIGLTRIFDRTFKALILHFRRWFSPLSEVYAKPELADRDLCGNLSVHEGVLLACATSVDAALTALGSGLGVGAVIVGAIFSFLFSYGAVRLGMWLGRRLAANLPVNISVIGGLVLIALAIAKLI